MKLAENHTGMLVFDLARRQAAIQILNLLVKQEVCRSMLVYGSEHVWEDVCDLLTNDFDRFPSLKVDFCFDVNN